MADRKIQDCSCCRALCWACRPSLAIPIALAVAAAAIAGRIGAGQRVATAAIVVSAAAVLLYIIAVPARVSKSESLPVTAERRDGAPTSLPVEVVADTTMIAPAPCVSAVDERLTHEPIVGTIGALFIEATIAIAASRSNIIEALGAAGAIDQAVTIFSDDGTAAAHPADLSRIPTSLLGTVLTSDVNLMCCLRDEFGNRLAYENGPLELIEQKFRKYANTATGTRRVAQERGTFVDGQFFTDDALLCVSRGYLDGDISISSISRVRLMKEVEEALAQLREYLQRAANPRD